MGSRPAASPDRSFTILKERNDILQSKFRVTRQFAILPTSEALHGANPKTPIARGEQACNKLAGELFT